MKRGKIICESLKAIRRDIAVANDIDYQPTECTHEGDCAGTCPKCESETRWLERQLRTRQALGKAIIIAGLSVALGTTSSCAGFHRENSADVDGYFEEDTLITAPAFVDDSISGPLSKSEKDSILNLSNGCEEDVDGMLESPSEDQEGENIE